MRILAKLSTYCLVLVASVSIGTDYVMGIATCPRSFAKMGKCKAPAGTAVCNIPPGTPPNLERAACKGPWNGPATSGVGVTTDMFYCSQQNATTNNTYCTTYSMTPGGPVVTAPCYRMFGCRMALLTDGVNTWWGCKIDIGRPVGAAVNAALKGTFDCNRTY